MASTDIEKKSLEAHVELCAERYSNLENKLSNLENRMEKLEGYLVEIKNSIVSAATANKTAEIKEDAGPYKMMITIGVALVGALIGGLFTLLVHIK